MWSLLRAAKACRDAAVAHRTPFISGKDSFNNEFEGPDGTRIAIPPSLLISAMGIVPDIASSPTTDLKDDSGLIYLVGEFSPTFCASVLQDIRFAGKGNAGSAISAHIDRGGAGPAFSDAAPAVYRKFHVAIRQSLVLSSHDLSDGGLGAALAEMCIGGNRGAEVDLDAIERSTFALSPNGEPKSLGRKEQYHEALLLFGETNGCFLAEISKGKAEAFEAAMTGVPCCRIGRATGGARVSITARGKQIASIGITELEKAFLNETTIALDDLAEDSPSFGGGK
jgi:phosphoribosylformylglycinamidine synthase